jgi:uncharacterized membrane protein
MTRSDPRSDPRSRLVRVLLFGVGVLPLLPILLRGVPGLSVIADVTEAWFGFQCERNPARALHWFGRVLPVCARWSGIYFGFGLGALVARPRLALPVLRLWVGMACLVMALDVLTEALGMRPPWAPLRVLTGALLSYPVSVALLNAARERWPGERAAIRAL